VRFYPPGFVAFSRRRCEQFVGEGVGHLHVLAEASRRMQLEEIFDARTLNLYVHSMANSRTDRFHSKGYVVSLFEADEISTRVRQRSIR
jgi:hypothetical protein